MCTFDDKEVAEHPLKSIWTLYCVPNHHFELWGKNEYNETAEIQTCQN